MAALSDEHGGERKGGAPAARGGPEGSRGGALVFVGFMGAGKSGAARKIAAALGVEPLDSDRELEAELGEPVESFFDREGEAAFRAREEAKVLELLARDDAAAISLGGGSIGSERVREVLGRHTVVHLEVTADEAWQRVSGKGRPLARDRDRFRALHAERQALYESIADATLSPGGRDLALRALPALLALRDARGQAGVGAGGSADAGGAGSSAGALAGAGVKLVWAEAASGSYPVFFGRGLVERGFAYPADARRFAVTDEQVAAHHRIGAEHTVAVSPGETHKTLATVERVLGELARAGAERGDLVVAVGGGVVGDLAGFCAAIYQRGIRCVQVPTTLVAQVDSAYGGKTGVDIAEGKNYAGAYHQPSAVICDPATLATLPAQELAAGYAEVVKTALIAGGPLWERVRGGGPVDDETILGCLRTKLAVVAEDERDAGRRQVLNLGHTVGHAIEAATGYARYRHGEAIAIGLLAALRLSGADDLRAQVALLFERHGLPLAFDGASVDDVVALTERDKKRAGGRVPFVLVDSPGRVTPGHDVEPARLRAAVAELHGG